MCQKLLILAAAAALASSLTGCQSKAYQTPAPPSLQMATSDASMPRPADAPGRMTLLYATTREAGGSADARSYADSAGDELRLGVATLRVDPSDSSAREPGILSLLSDRPSARLENLSERAVFGASSDLDLLSDETLRFFSEIDRALAASPDKDVFIYVHGGMIGVQRAVAHAAQYQQFTERNSVVVAFVWPTFEYFPSYVVDIYKARRSVPAFERFIELLAKHTQARHINILAHSAGSRIVSSALAVLGKTAGSAREEFRERLRLGEVYYAAADVEIRDFVRDLNRYADLPLRVTLQANSDDPILALLGMLPGSSRVGRLNLGELNAPERMSLQHWADESQLDVVDVTSERGGIFAARGHAYWFERRWVSSDVLLEFMYHAPPQARGLQEADKDGLKRWEFPRDYEQRAAAAMLRLQL